MSDVETKFKADFQKLLDSYGAEVKISENDVVVKINSVYNYKTDECVREFALFNMEIPKEWS